MERGAVGAAGTSSRWSDAVVVLTFRVPRAGMAIVALDGGLGGRLDAALVLAAVAPFAARVLIVAEVGDVFARARFAGLPREAPLVVSAFGAKVLDADPLVPVGVALVVVVARRVMRRAAGERRGGKGDKPQRERKERHS